MCSVVRRFPADVAPPPPQYKVVGFHVVGPNAGEITQGYAVAMKLGARKWDFDASIGIHPTVSEVRSPQKRPGESGLGTNVMRMTC